MQLKLLGNHQWKKKDNDGFFNVDFKYELTKEELEFVKSQVNTQLKKSINKDAKVRCSENYFGTKSDWKSLAKNIKQDIDNFIQQLFYTPVKGKSCPLCGLKAESKAFRNMNQSKNMLFNQHHNAPVRGANSVVTKEEMCPICNMLNVLATLQVEWHPYFIYDKVVHLLVPETSNLCSLSNLMKAISQNGLYQRFSCIHSGIY